MNQQPSNPSDLSSELDLGKLFDLIGRGFNRLFRSFLRLFLYLKRNIFWLVGLIIVGVVAGLLLRTLIVEKQQLDVIVTPQLNNVEYLNDVVMEIQADLAARDTALLRRIGLDSGQIDKIQIELEPIRDAKTSANSNRMAFLDVLKEFEQSDAIEDIVRSELQDQTTSDHRLSFYFKDPKYGEAFARKVIDYINNNDFYNELNAIYLENAQNRIRRNDSLINQIDLLIHNYTDRLAREQAGAPGQLMLENEESLDVPSLFELKNALIRATEEKKLELVQRKTPIRVVNFGKPHKINKSLFGKRIVWIPSLLLMGFFLLSIIKYLNAQAERLKKS